MTDTSSSPPATIPDVRLRPALDRWLRDRDLDGPAAGKLFGCSKQMIDDITRPFDDPKRKRPGRDLLTRIVRVTGGAVRPEDFSPPVDAIIRGMAA